MLWTGAELHVSGGGVRCLWALVSPSCMAARLVSILWLCVCVSVPAQLRSAHGCGCAHAVACLWSVQRVCKSAENPGSRDSKAGGLIIIRAKIPEAVTRGALLLIRPPYFTCVFLTTINTNKTTPPSKGKETEAGRG